MHLIAQHIAGNNNSVADAISCNLPQVLFSQVPEANSQLTPIPEPLWDILVMHQPDWLSDTWRISLIISLTIASHQAQEKPIPLLRQKYLNFCSCMKLNPLPANQQQLILFAAELSQTIAYSSTRTYLTTSSHF